MYFVGRIYGAAKQGLDPKELEPNDFLEPERLDLSGHPIYDEHDTTRRVGRVLHSFTSPHDSSKFVLGRIEAGETDLQEQVRNGSKQELSLMHVWWPEFKDDGTEVQKRIPFEVSLTKQGNRPNCEIIHLFEKTMSATTSTLPPPAATAAAAQAPPPETAAAASTISNDTTTHMDTYDEGKLLQTLKDEQIPLDEAYRHIAALTGKFKALEAAMGSMSSQTDNQEALARAQYEIDAKEWLAAQQRAGLVLTPEIVNATMDMNQRTPQLEQLIMANNLRLFKTVEQQNTEMMGELKVLREFHAAKRAKKPSGVGAYLDSLGSSSTHRTGSVSRGPSAMLKNSAVSVRVAEAMETPAFKRGFASQLDQQQPETSTDPEAFRKKMLGL
jgi:hypothetical protein